MFPFSWSFREWLRAVAVFSAGLLLGMGIWWTSPLFTGYAEPWDAGFRYYGGALFAAGFAATVFLPKAFWVAPIGVYTGQLLYGLYVYEPDGASLWPLGMVLAVFYGVATLAGALACTILMWFVRAVLRGLRFVFVMRSAKHANNAH